MLGMLEGSGYEKTGAGSAATIHYIAEVMRRFFADRSQYLGDSDFVKVPVKRLLDPAISARAARDRSIRITLRPAIRVNPGKPAGARRHGDHALFDHRRGGQRGRGYLHAEQWLRQRRYRSRLGLSAQRRNG